MSNKQLVGQNEQNQVVDLNVISQIGSYGVAELMAMKDTIGKELTIPQFNLFVHDSIRLGLEPRLKHVFPILYGGKMDFRISFEGYHAMAQKSEGYIGLKMEVVTENEIEDFCAETDDDGEITKVHHKIRFPRGKVVGSYAIAKREGKKNVIVFCDNPELSKYAKINAKFWKLEDNSLDPDMCKKHAGTRAIKAQFDVANVAEESTEAMYGAAPEVYSRKDITSEVQESQPQQLQQPKKDVVEETTTSTKEDFTARWTEVGALLDKLGHTTKQLKNAYIKSNFKTKGDEPTHEDFDKFIMLLEMQLAEQAAGDDLE